MTPPPSPPEVTEEEAQHWAGHPDACRTWPSCYHVTASDERTCGEAFIDRLLDDRTQHKTYIGKLEAALRAIREGTAQYTEGPYHPVGEVETHHWRPIGVHHAAGANPGFCLLCFDALLAPHTPRRAEEEVPHAK